MDESHISKSVCHRVGDRIGQYRATYQKVQNICHIEEERIGYTIVNYIYRNYASPLTAKSVAAKFPNHGTKAAAAAGGAGRVQL